MSRWGLVACLLACCGPGDATPRPSQDAESLLVWFDGCEVQGERCVGEVAGEVVGWTQGQEPVRVHVDGADARVDFEAVDGGLRWRMPITESDRSWSVTGVDGAWTLVVGPKTPRARPTAADCENPGQAFSGVQAVYARATCARRRWGQPSLTDREAAALNLHHELVAAARDLRSYKHHSGADTLLSVAFYMDAKVGAYDRAEAALNQIPDSGRGQGRWAQTHWRAVHARHLGELAEAQAFLAASDEVVRRLDMGGAWAEQNQVERSTQQHLLGDLDGALETYQALADRHPLRPDTCDARAHSLANNLGWMEVVRRQAGLEPTPALDPTALLTRVAEARERCNDPVELQQNTAIGRAFDAWSRQDWAAMLALLPPGETWATPDYDHWAIGLRSTALRESGEPRRALHEAVEGLSRSAPGTSIEAAALVRLAGAESAAVLGDHALALDLAEESQDQVLDALPSVPTGADHAAFIGLRYRLLPRILGLRLGILVRDGRHEEAFSVARVARVDALRALRAGASLSRLDARGRKRWESASEAYKTARQELADARAARWSLPSDALAQADRDEAELRAKADEALAAALGVLGAGPERALRPIGDGELMVLWVPVDDLWMGFVASETGVTVTPGPPADTPDMELAAALVSGLPDGVEDHDRLVVLPWGAVADLNLAAAERGGRPLGAQVPVLWSLDLPAASVAHASEQAVVIGDPRQDLPMARDEAERVGDALDTEPILGSEADLETVRAAFERAGRLHYAGHAKVDEHASWRSGLLLADDVLDVADLLSLTQAPRQVVLSGCETGRTRTDVGVASLGIAQALVLSGSEAVVATTAPIPDVDGTARASSLLPGASTPDQLALEVGSWGSQTGPSDSHWKVWVP